MITLLFLAASAQASQMPAGPLTMDKLDGLAIPAPAVGKAWSFAHVDRAGTLFVHESGAFHVSLADTRESNPTVVTLALDPGIGPNEINSIERVGSSSLVATTLFTKNDADILIGNEQTGLQQRPDLGLVKGGSIHRRADNQWWLIEGGEINLFAGSAQRTVSLKPGTISGLIQRALVGDRDELVLMDDAGCIHVISADGALIWTYKPMSKPASYIGITLIGGCPVICGQQTIAFLGVANLELELQSLDRPIWRPFTDRDRLLLVDLRSRTVFASQIPTAALQTFQQPIGDPTVMASVETAPLLRFIESL